MRSESSVTRQRTAHRDRAMRARGAQAFTLIELLVVVSLLVLLVALLLPALGKARDYGKSVNCLSQQRQIGHAHKAYGDDHERILMPLELPTQPPPPNPIINNPNFLRFPDMLTPYGPPREMYDCPSVGQSIWGPGRYGIGLNHIELSYSWNKVERIYRHAVARPQEAVLFADVGQVENHLELTDPDKWVEVPGRQLIYFLTPNHSHYFSAWSGPGLQQRVVPRHGGRMNGVFVDGHGEHMLASDMGFQYFPGVGGARGDNIIGGGNNLWDPRWKWGRK